MHMAAPLNSAICGRETSVVSGTLRILCRAHVHGMHIDESGRERVHTYRRRAVQTPARYLACMRCFGVALLLCAACVSGDDDPVTPVPGSGEPVVQEGYPDGPYNSTTQGGTIEPFELKGYARPALGTGEQFRTVISLADFYNPAGDGVHDEGSPFGAGEPK